MDAHSGPASSSAGGRQRAALAPLDANVVPSSPRPGFKDAGAPARGRDGAENRVGDGVGTKRPAGADEPADGSPTSKKACFGRDENNLRPQRSRSQSPDASSVFDASWATVATTTTVPDEPDVLNRVLPPAPRLTREQTRQVRLSGPLPLAPTGPFCGMGHGAALGD
ncbi:hypothetical protein HIM_07703 [Hirsutella minnesotensis 3608]|uniref:Uncharacterized protein n=1 Tax=Hirsutella minnesotensis 3608 TaxID=1043627 RepID=A0A0F7ZN11_9HYPO|nr:hypothetical protein HIM_07703 [Hirsutella minnesotensis 3608]